MPSCAVTVYVTGLLKFWGVPDEGYMDTPVIFISGISQLRAVPGGSIIFIESPVMCISTLEVSNVLPSLFFK